LSYYRKVLLIQTAVDEQYLTYGGIKMFLRDSILWLYFLLKFRRLTLRYPGTKVRGNILRRLFTILRFGGFLYLDDKNSTEYKWWHDTGFPIASALGTFYIL
jgi:hypothetical protein